MEDAEDLEPMAALMAAGKTTDNYYPGYEKLGLEIKNKTGKNITEFYIYETGATEKYNNMVPYLVDEEGNPVMEEYTYDSWVPAIYSIPSARGELRGLCGL